MSVSYELLFLHSIPFLARVGDSDKARTEGAVGRTEGAVGRKLYYYDAKRISDATEPIAIGSYENGAVKLDEGWQLRLLVLMPGKELLPLPSAGLSSPVLPSPVSLSELVRNQQIHQEQQQQQHPAQILHQSQGKNSIQVKQPTQTSSSYQRPSAVLRIPKADVESFGQMLKQHYETTKCWI